MNILRLLFLGEAIIASLFRERQVTSEHEWLLYVRFTEDYG